MNLPAIPWPPPKPLHTGPWDRYRLKAWYPVGARVEIDRFWWVDFPRGIYHSDRIRGQIVKYKRGDTTNFIVVQCDDGKEWFADTGRTRALIVDDDAPKLAPNGGSQRFGELLPMTQGSLFGELA
jgi:hypothetical protein